MLVYFLLIGVASLFVSFEFIIDSQSDELKQGLLDNFQQYSNSEMTYSTVFQPIDTIRNKAILMVAIIVFVIAIVLTMFTKNITGPLQHMIEVAKTLATGDLRQTISIRSGSELSELGNVINDLSSNLQETTILAKNVCTTGDTAITRTRAVLARETLSGQDKETIYRELDRLQQEIVSLEGLITCCKFYSAESND